MLCRISEVTGYELTVRHAWHGPGIFRKDQGMIMQTILPFGKPKIGFDSFNETIIELKSSVNKKGDNVFGSSYSPIQLTN